MAKSPWLFVILAMEAIPFPGIALGYNKNQTK